MNKIIIKIPEEGKKWQIGNFKRASVYTLLKLTERLLAKATLNEKTCVIVKYLDNTINETLPSNDAHYLIYATTCFLEDFLTPEYLHKVEKNWSNLGTR